MCSVFILFAILHRETKWETKRNKITQPNCVSFFFQWCFFKIITTEKRNERRMLAYVLLFTFCSIAASQYTNVDTGISRFGFEFYKVIDFAWFQDYKKWLILSVKKKLKKVFSRNRLFLFFLLLNELMILQQLACANLTIVWLFCSTTNRKRNMINDVQFIK